MLRWKKNQPLNNTIRRIQAPLCLSASIYSIGTCYTRLEHSQPVCAKDVGQFDAFYFVKIIYGINLTKQLTHDNFPMEYVPKLKHLLNDTDFI